MNKKQRNIWFFDKWASNYDHSILSPWLKSMHKDVLKFINPNKPELKVLDISCGTGEFLSILSKKLENPSLYGADISKNMLDIAKKKLTNKAEIAYADVESLPFKDSTFDYVITTEAFHHYVDQRKSFAEMKRVLKKDGILIIADVNFSLSLFHRIFESFEPGCVRINSRKEFIAMFKSNSFKNIKQKRSSLFGIITAGINSK